MHLHPVGVSPDAKVFAWGGFDGSVRLWDLEGQMELPPLILGEGDISSLTFSADAEPDGRFLASAGFDKTVRLWRAPS